MNTLVRGDAAESAVLHALVKRGHAVLLPFGQSQPFDLVIHLGGATFVRVQCKNARLDRGCALFNGYATDHGKGVTRYAGLADIFGVYFASHDAVYLVPVDELLAHHGRLRLDPPRNNQRERVRLAADYEIDRWSRNRLRAAVRGERAAPRSRGLPAQRAGGA